MRILGKGKTAVAIKEIYSNSVMYDDNDIDKFDINSTEATVVSPGIPPSNHLVKNSKNLISEYDLFKEDIPFSIWISGTNGKTTTTQMVAHLLDNQSIDVGGNIGKPLALMDKTKKIWILECSSFTLHYTKVAKPNIYILLPIHPDHLSWHGTFSDYEQSKLNPLDLMGSKDIAIVPSKYKNYKTKTQLICYHDSNDLAKQFDIDISKIKFTEPFLLDAVLGLVGQKIVTNKVDYNKINSFIQDPHKQEEFYDQYNRLWVDDSKATNIDATVQALKRYKDKKIYLILGGDDKGVELNELFENLQKYNIEIFTIGKNSQKLHRYADRYNIKSNSYLYLEDAVIAIDSKYTDINSSVAILSPAAASLDQYNSYKDRGEKFKQFVNSFSN